MVSRRLYVAKPHVLKRLRSGMGTVRGIAKEMGIHYSYLSGVENRRRSVTLESATLIAKYYGQRVMDLFNIRGVS